MSIQQASKISSIDSKLGPVQKGPQKASFWNGRNVSIAIVGVVALAAISAYLCSGAGKVNSDIVKNLLVQDQVCDLSSSEMSKFYRGPVYVNSDNKPPCLYSVMDHVCSAALDKISKEKNISITKYGSVGSDMYFSCSGIIQKEHSKYFNHWGSVVMNGDGYSSITNDYSYTDNPWIDHPFLSKFTSNFLFGKKSIKMLLSVIIRD